MKDTKGTRYPIVGEDLDPSLVEVVGGTVPVAEQETVVSYARDGESARVCTSDLTVLTRMRKACREGGEWRLVRIDAVGGRQTDWTFEGPKRLVRIAARRRGQTNPHPFVRRADADVDADVDDPTDAG